jgi:hypothetical protein
MAVSFHFYRVLTMAAKCVRMCGSTSKRPNLPATSHTAADHRDCLSRAMHTPGPIQAQRSHGTEYAALYQRRTVRMLGCDLTEMFQCKNVVYNVYSMPFENPRDFEKSHVFL